ncbi:MAG: LamG domain-containing protein, partial [Planctomycetota bacterium]
MSKKLIYLVSFVFALELILTNAGNAAGTDLVGWWKFDETSGNIAHDASGNGNDGAVKGNPIWAAGRIAGALQLDGDGDYLEIGSVGISGMDPRTLAGWAKASTTAIPSWTSVFGFAPDGNTDGTYYDIAVDDSGNYVLNIQGWAAIFCAVDTEWHHFAVTYNGNEGSSYLDGQYIDSEEGPIITIDHVRIGANLENNNFFPGLIDDVRIYNKALTLEEIKEVMAGPRAHEPAPADGTLNQDLWVILGWLPGADAASHDIYLGESFDDVNDGAEGTYCGNQSTLFFTAGFSGSPYPDGLVPGVTYYWRIDEVQVDGATIQKGDIWSFTVPSKCAYLPIPANGAKFIDPDVELSWTPGFEAKLHTVYFGDNFDDVNNAEGGSSISFIGHSPTPLEPGKTYYWRVDEDDAYNTYKGTVWCFTTAGPVGGIRGDYY